MRVLIMHTWAGLPARQHLYAKLAASTGWHIRMVTVQRWVDEFGRTVEAAPTPEFEHDLVPIPVGLRGNIPLHFFTRRIRPHLRRFDPDLVYIYHEPYAVGTWQMLRASRAATRAPIGVRSAQNIAKDYPLPFAWMERDVYRHSDFAVVVSDRVADVMRSKGYRQPVEVVPMPVDLSVFRASAPATASTGSPLRIGFVGRLVPEKGVDTALRALAGTDRGRAVLTVVGSGPDEERLRLLARSLGIDDRVHWAGTLDRDATARAYREMDLVVVPSRRTARWQEQFGRVVIEAGACAVPSVVTRSGELPHLLDEVGAGWVVDEDDHRRMADLLRRLDADRGELVRAGTAARRGVAARFGEETIVAGLAATFEAAHRRGRR